MNEKFKQMPYPPESAVDKIGRLLNDVLDRVDVLEFHEKMIAFIEKIKENHPDYKRYRCYHKLIGSTIPKDRPDIIEEDFEGEDSVIGFLEGSLLKEEEVGQS